MVTVGRGYLCGASTACANSLVSRVAGAATAAAAHVQRVKQQYGPAAVRPRFSALRAAGPRSRRQNHRGVSTALTVNRAHVSITRTGAGPSSLGAAPPTSGTLEGAAPVGRAGAGIPTLLLNKHMVAGGRGRFCGASAACAKRLKVASLAPHTAAAAHVRRVIQPMKSP